MIGRLGNSLDVLDRAARLLGVADVSDRAARLLGRVSEGLADSGLAGGRVLAPAAGTALCTLAAPPAGKYRVRVSCGQGGALATADVGNIELRRAAAVLLSGIGQSPFELIVTLDGTQALSLNATAAANAGSAYTAVLAATRIE